MNRNIFITMIYFSMLPKSDNKINIIKKHASIYVDIDVCYLVGSMGYMRMAAATCGGA